jgi:DNA-binding NarL/FixJ family response regulator
MGEIPPKSGPIRVLLADDHTMFRQGLAAILASYGGMEVIAEVPNDADALQLARDLEPDVVIMQVQLPFSRAVQTLKAMRSFPKPPKVIIVTMFESPRYIRALTGVEASVYLLKTSPAEHLVAAVRAAAFDPASESVVVGMPEGTKEGAESVLTARELERSCFWPPGPLQRAHSLLFAPLGGYRKAPPRQRLHQDGRPLQGPGLKGGAP